MGNSELLALRSIGFFKLYQETQELKYLDNAVKRGEKAIAMLSNSPNQECFLTILKSMQSWRYELECSKMPVRTD